MPDDSPAKPQDEGAQSQEITLTGSYDEVPKMDEPLQATEGADRHDGPQSVRDTSILPWNLEVARAIVQSASNLPAVVYGPHLIMVPEEVECAVAPLFAVGQKYGLDQFQYMAELSLVLALAAIGGVMRQKHEAHKKAAGQDKEQSQAVREADKLRQAADKFDEAVSRI